MTNEDGPPNYSGPPSSRPSVPPEIESFISRWENSGAAERANYQMFLSELCDVLEVARPDPTSPDPENNLYVFDRAITRGNPDGTSVTNYIDLYKARHFVCETKQGITAEETIVSTKSGHGKRGSIAFDKALERAYHQGRDYITHLPASHGRPPFLIVCDVGHSIDLYSEFTCTGGRYERFPDPAHHRILLTDLRRPEIRERLRLVFTDPLSLDPTKRAAEVTRDIATRLAKLAKSLEAAGHDAQIIAGFLQRCLFTMFAEDIGLLPENGFRNLLEKVKSSPQGFPVLISGLWREMASGAQYSALLFQEIAHFNGGLFETTTALPLTGAQLDMLAAAAASDWSDVEPSIFGTLLTRALDSRERHKLGAEYTPRSYVERLIRPTIIEPLRDEWEATRIAAAKLHSEADYLVIQADVFADEMKSLGATPAAKALGATAAKHRNDAKKKDAEALKLVTAFHRHLCAIKILDPACGTANFLYVTLEHLKRLEAEVLELITALGGDATFEMNEYKVRPEQFLGLELSPNAVAIAQLVLWIGYFQWQRKTTGKADTGDRPLLPKTQSIRQQDAVLDYDEKIPRRDETTGEILTIWNGHTTKPHPVTGKEVPDETARTVLFDYINPRRAEWPQADYIVGNPPFIGARTNRQYLGDGYLSALRAAHSDIPANIDFVMYWWNHSAKLLKQGKIKRFGFITTNSITQSFNQAVVEPALKNTPSIFLQYAVPDHPWVDSADGAAIRIAMTVAAKSPQEGTLAIVANEEPAGDGLEMNVELKLQQGALSPVLKINSDVSQATELISNSKLSCVGYQLTGQGFVVSDKFVEELPEQETRYVAPLLTARDIVQSPRRQNAINVSQIKESELQKSLPSIYQHLYVHVYPERKVNNRKSVREYWWVYGEARNTFRPALKDLKFAVVTPLTAKHRPFVAIDLRTIADSTTVLFAFDDFYFLGVLSSSIHVSWVLAAGGTLEDRPRYNKSVCFETFPFPAIEEGELKQRIRDLGERLDAHRKRQQELHPGLTLTGMYNVLEKLRSGEALTAKEKQIHDQGLVSLLKQLHDDLDQAVLEAYGWQDLSAKETHCSGGLRPSMPLAESEGASSFAIDGHRPPLQNTSSATPQSMEDELLTRLVALNHRRAAEEKSGLIRWLRPEYQNPSASVISDGHKPPQQANLPGTEATTAQSKIQNQQSSIINPSSTWPTKLPAQVTLIRQLLSTNPTATAEILSQQFGRKNQKRTEQIEGIIETLRGLGQV